ncbi:MAG: c-type cytochrome [Geminicoccaceae bacterium]
MSTDPGREVPSSRQGSARPRLARFAALAIGLGLLGAGALAQDQAQPDDPERDAEGSIVFLHALDNQPIAFTLRPEQEITPAVEQFHKTAENAYAGDPAAIEAGQEIYARLCQACHLADGTGRIGPSLADGEGARARTGTDRGRFEIIYAGGAGAMQAFGQRLDQDQILQVVAYLEVLREGAD